nr:protein chibby homolog 3 [Chanos chanos]
MSVLREILDKLGGPTIECSRVWKPKKSPVRQVASLSTLYVLDYNSRLHELGLHAGPPTLTLGGQTLTFSNGQWVSSESMQNSQERFRTRNLRRKIHKLQMENKELKLRVEVLMDMLTHTVIHLQALENLQIQSDS